ncbi:ACP S-malonyltransferase [Sorangium sp. So ce362]|uniref:ACP S-malonyltransferase n=1 Tax=Sorangium sp. So ce362 TaxID=3133303 RepID=UPI003F61F942
MKTYMFPGQGSQSQGMGGELFAEFPAITAKADEVLGYSIRELCSEDPRQQLGQTQFTQPALYVVNALMFLKRRQKEALPDFLVGHSLGEYNALFAAGVFDFETGLELVKKRGELMSQARDGGMAAVAGLAPEQVRKVLAQNGAEAVDVANINSPSQVVIAGGKHEISRLQAPFERAGAKRYTVLRVSAAFHSRFMRPAMEEFGRFLTSHRFAPPAIPVISNLTARPYRADRIRDTLCEQIASPVRWCESIRYLMGKGVKEFVECGHGIVLTGLYSQIRRDAQPLIVDDDQPGSPPADGAEAGRSPADTTSREPARPAAAASSRRVSPESLGSSAFREDYRLRYAYVAGSLVEGISSREMVVRMGKAGLIGYLGTKGLTLDEIDRAIRGIQAELRGEGSYGVSLWCDLDAPRLEREAVDLYLKHDVRNIEALACLQVTPDLVRFRLTGAHRDASGRAAARRRVLARVSHPEIARALMSPAPEQILDRLLEEGVLTREEAALGRELPVSEDICVHADSGGHTELGSGAALMPFMVRLRDEMMTRHRYGKPIRVGLSGGIGAPEAAASAFVLGADFIVTNSINQCSPEAGTSDRVKDMLQAVNVQDTTYAPAGDMLERGTKVQVLKRGVLFPARANRLHELYRQHASLNDLDKKTTDQLQKSYFKRDLGEVWEDTQSYWLRTHPEELDRAERDPRRKMSLVFGWYFRRSSELARRGEANQVDYQVQCGPAMGAFNQWVRDTVLESWRGRHVDVIAERLMQASADLLDRRLRALSR